MTYSGFGGPLGPRRGVGDRGYEQSSRDARRRAREAAGEPKLRSSSTSYASLPPSPEPKKAHTPPTISASDNKQPSITRSDCAIATNPKDNLAVIDIAEANSNVMARLPRPEGNKPPYFGGRRPYDVVDRSTLLIWLREELFLPSEVVAKLEAAGVHPKAARNVVRMAMDAIGEFY